MGAPGYGGAADGSSKTSQLREQETHDLAVGAGAAAREGTISKIKSTVSRGMKRGSNRSTIGSGGSVSPPGTLSPSSADHPPVRSMSGRRQGDSYVRKVFRSHVAGEGGGSASNQPSPVSKSTPTTGGQQSGGSPWGVAPQPTSSAAADRPSSGGGGGGGGASGGAAAVTDGDGTTVGGVNTAGKLSEGGSGGVISGSANANANSTTNTNTNTNTSSSSSSSGKGNRHSVGGSSGSPFSGVVSRVPSLGVAGGAASVMPRPTVKTTEDVNTSSSSADVNTAAGSSSSRAGAEAAAGASVAAGSRSDAQGGPVGVTWLHRRVRGAPKNTVGHGAATNSVEGGGGGALEFVGVENGGGSNRDVEDVHRLVSKAARSDSQDVAATALVVSRNQACGEGV